MSDQYKDDEGRLAKLLGQTRAHQAKAFEMANLRSVADITVSTGSALPHQRGARIQTLLDIGRERPGVVSDEMFIDVTGLGEVQRFQNAITVALQKAESENQMIYDGGKPRDPDDAEFHLHHYRVHMRGRNEEAFNSLPDEQKMIFDDHIMATEMLMWQAGERNPQYVMQVMAEFPTFPVFFVPDLPALPMASGDPMAAGMAAQPSAAMPVAAPGPMALPPEAIPAGLESITPPDQGLDPGVETLEQGAPVA
jgi:hypothetical protein